MIAIPKYYLIIGTTQNWDKAFQHNPPIWGFTEKERIAWDSLQSGDILYFYAAKEAKGIIGKGIVLNKFHGNNPYWPGEEIGVKWGLRFYIQPVCLLPPSMWQAGQGPIPCTSFDLVSARLQAQIIRLESEQVAKIEEIINTWPAVDVGYGAPAEEEIPLVKEPSMPHPIDPHAELVKTLEEMAKLQYLYPQTEFSIPDEKRRIDIVWRREIRGTPTYAFEVELSGGVDKALNKLYKCFRLWSTQPRIIIPSSERTKVQNIIAGMEPKFKQSVIAIEPSHIQDLYTKKKTFKEMEKEIGLL